jgi:hypothetical protein
VRLNSETKQLRTRSCSNKHTLNGTKSFPFQRSVLTKKCRFGGQFLAGNGWSCKFMHDLRINRPQTCTNCGLRPIRKVCLFVRFFSPRPFRQKLDTIWAGVTHSAPLRGRDLPPFSAITSRQRGSTACRASLGTSFEFYFIYLF